MRSSKLMASKSACGVPSCFLPCHTPPSRGEIVVQLVHKVLKQADEQRVLILVPRVYRAGGDPGFSRRSCGAKPSDSRRKGTPHVPARVMPPSSE